MEVVQKLQKFKEWVREGLLSKDTHFQIKMYEKIFSFELFCYENKPKQNVTVSMSSIKMIVRLLQIIEIVLELFQKDESITKRNLYYKLINYYSSKYYQVSLDLQVICINLSITRDQLRIASSSRCLLFGHLCIKNEGDNLVCSPQFITNVSTNIKHFQIQTFCKILLVVEKESALYQIHQKLIKRMEVCQPAQKKSIQSVMVLASKGYPDNTTRKLIEALLPFVDQIFYLGDQDIYGLDILLSYTVVSTEWTNYLQRVKWIQFCGLVDMRQVEKQLQMQSKQDRIKSIQILQRPYFKNIEIFMANTTKQKLYKDKLIAWKSQLKKVQLSDTKLQLESFLKVIPDNWLQIILSQKYYL